VFNGCEHSGGGYCRPLLRFVGLDFVRSIFFPSAGVAEAVYSQAAYSFL
jgi:hypothetical protein